MPTDIQRMYCDFSHPSSWWSDSVCKERWRQVSSLFNCVWMGHWVNIKTSECLDPCWIPRQLQMNPGPEGGRSFLNATIEVQHNSRGMHKLGCYCCSWEVLGIRGDAGSCKERIHGGNLHYKNTQQWWGNKLNWFQEAEGSPEGIILNSNCIVDIEYPSISISISETNKWMTQIYNNIIRQLCLELQQLN